MVEEFRRVGCEVGEAGGGIESEEGRWHAACGFEEADAGLREAGGY